jgi:large subunit ribosomal protein L16
MKGRNTGLAQRANKVSFGEYGLKATTRGRITARQIEAARRTMTRRIKRGGKIWIRIFPDKPISSKPLEVRMGKGKGGHHKWICPIKKGQILVEFRLRKRKLLDILLLLRKCRKRLPLKCQIVTRSKKLLKNNLEKNFKKFLG